MLSSFLGGMLLPHGTVLKMQNASWTAERGDLSWAEVVFETAVSPATTCGPNACLAIGFSVFLAFGGPTEVEPSISHTLTRTRGGQRAVLPRSRTSVGWWPGASKAPVPPPHRRLLH